MDVVVDRWQLQEAKQRFSEVVRAAHSRGPQYVTRHGRDVAVLVYIAEYEDLTHSGPDFKAYLTEGPKLDDLELDREPPSERAVDLE